MRESLPAAFRRGLIRCVECSTNLAWFRSFGSGSRLTGQRMKADLESALCVFWYSRS